MLDGSVTAAHLRTGVDDNLIRLHPRITYHLARVISADSRSMIAEIAADGSRELILESLKKLESKMPVTIEGLEWGWSANTNTLPEIGRALKQDHLASVNPGVGYVAFEPDKKTFLIRYILVLSLTIALFFSLALKFYLERSFVLDLTYVIMMIIWFFSLNEIPLDIRRYAAKIECNEENVKITYWIGKKKVAIDWQAIWGMESTSREFRLYHGEKTERFILNARNGRKETETMLKTIIERASLRFVQVGFQKAVYKRHDAPAE